MEIDTIYMPSMKTIFIFNTSTMGSLGCLSCKASILEPLSYAYRLRIHRNHLAYPMKRRSAHYGVCTSYPSSPLQALDEWIIRKQLHRFWRGPAKHSKPRCDFEMRPMGQESCQTWGIFNLGWRSMSWALNNYSVGMKYQY